MYLLVLIIDVAGVAILARIAGNGSFLDTAHSIAAHETLYRIGLCCGLVGYVSTVLLGVGLYVIVKRVDGNLAMMALLFRLAERDRWTGGRDRLRHPSNPSGRESRQRI